MGFLAGRQRQLVKFLHRDHDMLGIIHCDATTLCGRPKPFQPCRHSQSAKLKPQLVRCEQGNVMGEN